MSTTNKNLVFRMLRRYKRFQIRRTPQMNIVWGFLLYTLTGWLLLSIPVFHITDVSFLDNLFISASAISTTGLVTISIADSYNLAGQIVVAALIQVGGIGYMTLTTYYLLLTTKSITHWHGRIIGTAFTMPKGIQVKDFLKSVIIFTSVMEVIGAICFYGQFTADGMATGKAIWFGIFHSISAFCTAGFGLFNDSFISYSENVFINILICVLAIAGSLGFIVITDLWYRVSGRSKHLSFTTNIVIYGMALLLAFGTLVMYFSEPLFQGQDAFMESFFQAMTAMTTVGFNTIDTGALSIPILLLVIFLMYVGASPSGTAGGMKITTLTAMIAILKSRLFGERRINFLNHQIPFERLYVATSTFILYTSMIFVFTFIMAFTERAPFENILFEVASALGTVGLSTGITGDLTMPGKLCIIILMFTGRVGVLTFGFALLQRKRRGDLPEIEDDLAV